MSPLPFDRPPPPPAGSPSTPQRPTPAHPLLNVSNTDSLTVIKAICDQLKAFPHIRNPKPNMPLYLCLHQIADILTTGLNAPHIRTLFPHLVALYNLNTPMPLSLPNAPPIILATDPLARVKQRDFEIRQNNLNNEHTANTLLVAAFADAIGPNYLHAISLPIAGPLGIDTLSLANQTIHGAIISFSSAFDISASASQATTLQATYETPFPTNLTMVDCIAIHSTNVLNLKRIGCEPPHTAVSQQFVKNVVALHPQYRPIVDLLDVFLPTLNDRTWPAVRAFFAPRGQVIDNQLLHDASAASVTAISNPDASAVQRSNYAKARTSGPGPGPTMSLHADSGPLDLRSFTDALRQLGLRVTPDYSNRNPRDHRPQQQPRRNNASGTIVPTRNTRPHYMTYAPAATPRSRAPQRRSSASANIAAIDEDYDISDLGDIPYDDTAFYADNVEELADVSDADHDLDMDS